MLFVIFKSAIKVFVPGRRRFWVSRLGNKYCSIPHLQETITHHYGATLELFLLIPHQQETISYRYSAVRGKTPILTPLETTKCPRSVRSAVQFKKRVFDNKLGKTVCEGMATL